MIKKKQIDAIPMACLQANIIPREYHFDAWRESTAPFFNSEPLERDWHFPGDSICYFVDQLMFTHVQFSKTRFSTRKAGVSSGNGDCIVLQYNYSGRQKGILDNGDILELGPDRICLVDFAQGYKSVCDESNTFGVAIPRYLLRCHDLMYQKKPIISWSIESVQGKLISSALASIWRDLPTLQQQDAKIMASGFIGLLNGLLASEGDLSYCHHVEKTAFEAMKAFLSTNLLQADLEIEDLCKHFHCSRATVYRLFSNFGGVQSFIRQQRLTHCFQEMLLTPQAHSGVIRQIAEHWGFYDAAHFSRQFKQHIGMRPSDVIPDQSKYLQKANTACHQEGWQDVKRLKSWAQKF